VERLKGHLTDIFFCVGFSALFSRCIAIVLIAYFGNNNKFGFIATQLLDGISAGFGSLGLYLIANKLAKGTERKGNRALRLGCVFASWVVGASLSN